MFNFICGKIISVDNGVLILQCGHIGYELCISDYTALNCAVGDDVQVYTYLQVKEDGLTLYGFSSEEEKKIFLQLITVSGIGCKMAMAVLSNCSINDLAMAIVTGDSKRLAGVKGIGKKTAERIVLELREKVVPPANIGKTIEPISNFTNEQLDAISVLISLGISRIDAENRVRKACESGLAKTEDILNTALKTLR